MFFFSSRRRHTRLQGDWSSDVCSSDLIQAYLPDALRDYERSARYQALVQEEEAKRRSEGAEREQREAEQATFEVTWRQIGRASCREGGWIGAGEGGLRDNEWKRHEAEA